MTALSSLPPDDLQEGFQVLTDIKFTDETLEGPKAILLAYVEKYWIHGCYPPFVWNTWGRRDDFTNNNQV